MMVWLGPGSIGSAFHFQVVKEQLHDFLARVLIWFASRFLQLIHSYAQGVNDTTIGESELNRRVGPPDFKEPFHAEKAMMLTGNHQGCPASAVLIFVLVGCSQRRIHISPYVFVGIWPYYSLERAWPNLEAWRFLQRFFRRTPVH